MRTRFYRRWAVLGLFVSVAWAWPASATRRKGIDQALLAKANAGSAEAQNQLGNAYYFGDGVRRDYAQAAIWYRKAATQGDPDSEFRIGGMYHFGQGVPQDDVQAFDWIKKAAEQQHGEAEFFLSTCYSEGWGVAEDDAHSFFWLRRAAQDGNANAQYFLGWAYEHGFEVHQNYSDAYFWLKLAAADADTRKDERKARKKRDEAASHLTPVELSQVQERVRKWLENHPAKAE